MREMTVEERRAFLQDSPRIAKVASVRVDGRPHIAPVWFVMDGDHLVFTTWYSTVKAANLAHNPQVAVCVDEETPPFAYVIVEGIAHLDAHAPDLLTWTTRLAGKYMGDAQAESYGRRNAVEGEILVRVKPTRIITAAGIAD